MSAVLDQVRPIRRSARRLLAGAVFIALAAACVPDAAPAPVAADFHLVARLGAASADLHWDPAPANPAGYEVQWRTIAETTWSDGLFVPTSTASVTGLFSRTNYVFRVRATDANHAPIGDWSPEQGLLYVVPTLPIVRIDTNGEAPVLDKDNYVPSTMDLDPNGSGLAAYHGTLGVRGRGNSTWNYPKKPYRLKLDAKAPMLGLPSDKDWVLLANYLDRSQLRNYVASELSSVTDLDWTPHFRHVEVVFNGQYDGVYLLGEHVKVDDDRIDIDEMKPTDIAGDSLTGGYLLEMDARLEENNEPGFRTTRNAPIVVKDPDPAQPEQMAYIKGTVQAFEDALFSPEFADPVVGYRAHLDVDSFIDAYLVEELTRQQDAFYASTFFTKPRNGKLRAGPLWDFDLSMGDVAPLAVASPPMGWWVNSTSRPWISRFFEDPTFVAAVEARWAELKPAFLDVVAHIGSVGVSIRPAVLDDSVRWGYFPDDTDDPSFLAAWLTTRIDWMDHSL